MMVDTLEKIPNLTRYQENANKTQQDSIFNQSGIDPKRNHIKHG